MAECTVRQATIEDAPALARLRWEFSPDETAQPGETYAAFQYHFTNFLADAFARQRWTIFVAEHAGLVIGNSYIQRVMKVPRPGRFGAAFGFVSNVYIDPSWRDQGVGGQLLIALIAWARAEDLQSLMLWPSARSIPFYQRHGFRPIGDALELDLR